MKFVYVTFTVAGIQDFMSRSVRFKMDKEWLFYTNANTCLRSSVNNFHILEMADLICILLGKCIGEAFSIVILYTEQKLKQFEFC